MSGSMTALWEAGDHGWGGTVTDHHQVRRGTGPAPRVGDAYASQFVTTRTGDYLGVDRAMAAVRKEVARRGWVDV